MAGRLGLGLGLNRFQRGRFLEAAQGGNAQEYLAGRPELQQRIQNRIQAGSPREAALQNFMASGATPTGAAVRYPTRPQPLGGGGAPPTAGATGDNVQDQARLAAQAQMQYRPPPGRGPGPGGPPGQARQQARQVRQQARQQVRGGGRR
jgi:hypothetical protein